jgi:hypothetical protein
MFPNPSAELLREWVARIRGEFLARQFSIDNELVLISLTETFGSPDAAIGGQPFQELEDKLRKKTLGTLLGLVAATALHTLGQSEGDAWTGTAAELLQVRNTLAHQPFWLEPINDPNAGTIPGGVRLRTVSFRPMIADSSSIWTLDDEQVAYWVALQREMLHRAQQVRRLLSRSNGKTPPANNKHYYPLGISIPNGRPIPNPKSKLATFYHGADAPELPCVPGKRLTALVKLEATMDAHTEMTFGTESNGNLSQ